MNSLLCARASLLRCGRCREAAAAVAVAEAGRAAHRKAFGADRCGSD